MAEERQGSREIPFRRVASWTQILRTFLVALDPFKLLIAAFGILATAIGWWLISLVIWSFWSAPNPEDFKPGPEDKPERAAELLAELKAKQERFYFMATLAGSGGEVEILGAKRPMPEKGLYRVMPWLEDRGPNPWHLTKTLVGGSPEDRGKSLEWFYKNQAPNLVEPLRKFLSPIMNLFDSRGNGWTQFYLILILLWFLIVWAFVGGVITRMAMLQLAGKEGGSLRESIQFVSARYWSYFWSPLVPIIMIGIIVVCCILFGLARFIPIIGDTLFDGLLFFLPLAAGFVMALLIVGLIGYPLMYSTLSAEGSDTFDSLSRSYNYVYESPWSYIWYGFIAILYGAVLIFFVVFMASFMVFLTKWGLSKTPFADLSWIDRTTEHLFMYSPTSFGWRELLMGGTPLELKPGTLEYVNSEMATAYMNGLEWHSKIGAGLVGFWLTLLFLMMLGFGYSFFWTASSMIYLLMRKKVDETEMDEIYVEEEEYDDPMPPVATAPAPAPAPTGGQMVDAPALRVTPAPTPTPAPVPAPAPAPAPAPTAPVSIPVSGPNPEKTPEAAPAPDKPKEGPRGDSDPTK